MSRDVLHGPDTNPASALACFDTGSMIVALSAPGFWRFGDQALMLTRATVIPLVLASATVMLFQPTGNILVAPAI